MKFAHLADCHVGGWREPKLRQANAASFSRAIDMCLKERVDFVLVAGDLFNSAVPSIESLQHVVQDLMRLKGGCIPVYAIAGSHDFSPAGKTMLDVLESAQLLTNVVRGSVVDQKLHLEFTTDKKTGAKIVGMLGKKGGLEKGYYEDLYTAHLEKESGYKIFLFHSAIEELKPKGMEQMEGIAGSLLPKNFSYYAGGHVHVTDHKSLQERHHIVYPGPIFPNNFAELEKLKSGSFCIVEDERIMHVPIEVHPVFSVRVSADNKEACQVEEEVFTEVQKVVKDAIVTIRVEGVLKSGKAADICWERIYHVAMQCGACVVLKNTSGLQVPQVFDVRVPNKSVEEIEQGIITENPSRFSVFSQTKNCSVVKELMQGLQQEKNEGERVVDFEARIVAVADSIIEK